MFRVTIISAAWVGIFVAVAQATENPFVCNPAETFEALSVEQSPLKMNNFSIEESLSSLTDQIANVRITYAAVNRSTAEAFIGADFLLMDERKQPLATVTASPKARLQRYGSAIATGDTTTLPGTLARAKSICMRFISFTLPATSR